MVCEFLLTVLLWLLSLAPLAVFPSVPWVPGNSGRQVESQGASEFSACVRGPQTVSRRSKVGRPAHLLWLNTAEV